jgi:hypothetical protein
MALVIRARLNNIAQLTLVLAGISLLVWVLVRLIAHQPGPLPSLDVHEPGDLRFALLRGGLHTSLR